MNPRSSSTAAARAGEHPTSRVRRFRRLRTAAAVVGAALGGFVIVMALGNLFPAATNLVTLLGTFVWANFAPHLVLLSVGAVLLCVPLWRARRQPVLRGVASALAVGALVTSSAITGVMMSAAAEHGGSVNLARAVSLTTPSQGPDTTTSYVTVDGAEQEALIYAPPRGTKGAPVMMYIHGGGWYMGSAAESNSIARWYADRGWYVVSVDYRLADATHPTWDKAPADVACALAWTAQRATAAGADADRLTVHGDSAGGHLAMLLGWSAADGAAASSCPDLGKVPVPDAVIAGYPVSNIEYTYDHGTAPIASINPQTFTRDFLGGIPSSVRDRVDAVSPSTYLSDATPPTLILQPERDDFIPAEGNYRVADQAQRTGVDLTIASVPFAWHGFDSFPGSIGGQIKNAVTMTWLDQHGLAP